MKVGNTINGLTITDVKRVNKLNLIQFLKEVDSYLQKGYQIDVTSARQVGLVLMVDVYKTEAASSVKVGSVGEQIPAESVSDSSKEAEPVSEDTSVPDEATAYKERLEKEGFSTEWVDGDKKEVEVEATTPTEDEAVIRANEEAPVASKKTTTRSKKTAQ